MKKVKFKVEVMMIEIRGLEKKYKNRCVFQNADFIINEENTINCILGPSGSGKTTLFQILFGLDMNYEGKYFINGENAKELSMKQWEKLRTNYIQIVYQDFKLLEHLTVYENMLFAANDQNESTKSKIEQLLKDMNLDRIRNSKVLKISGGEKQRLAFARALVLDPKVVLLDEPTGNLDNENTNLIMQQIQQMAKHDVTIIIITHDERVIPFCDHIYEIKDQKLINKTEINTSNVIHSSTPINNDNKKTKAIQYVIKRYRSNIMEVLLENLPIIAIFIIFISIFGLIYSKSIDENRRFYGGIKDDVIVLSTSNYTNKYKDEMAEKGIGPFNDGVRIGFSEKDLDDVMKISGVKDARLCNTSTISSFDSDGDLLDLKLNKRDLSSYVRKQSNYSRIPDNLTFSFTTLTVPFEFIHSYNPKEINLRYGQFPKNKNEILIPDILAHQYKSHEEIESLIGKEITLPVFNDENIDKEKNYVISGIYEIDFNSKTESEISIYVAYHEFDFLDLFRTKQSYEQVKREYETANGDAKGTVYETYDSYIEALGTNLQDMMIRLTSTDQVENVTQEITKLFPNLKQLSQYGFQHGDFKESYQQMMIEIFGIIMIIALCFGFIIVFINKNYIKNRNKEMAILYSLGYSKVSVVKIIICEYLFSTSINYLVAYAVIFLAFKAYLYTTSFYFLMTIILNLNVFLLGFVFIIFMTVISVLFAIRGVKRKNLQKYLR